MEIDFQNLRDQWALKAPTLAKESIQMEYQMDRNLNPHNEPYLNKKPLRSEAEIVSDRAYTFADAVLAKQYPVEYKDWLEENGYFTKWGVVVKTNNKFS